MVAKKSWKEFRETGLLWFVNTILHVFGWAIVVMMDDGEIKDVYPARVKFRGFSETTNTKGYVNLTKYLYENCKDLLVDVDDNHDDEKENNKKIEDYSWTEIDSIVKEGKHKELFKIGDTKSFRLGDETLVAQIADFDHDNLTDGIGKAGISFIIKDCMNTKHNMNSYSNNAGGWTGSDIREYLNTDIYNQLPFDMQSVIKPVVKLTSKGNGSSILESSNDKLWLMSRVEMFSGSDITYTPDGEGYQYPIFKDIANRRKVRNGKFDCYWLRSPRVESYILFCRMEADGTLSSGASAYERGVVFGFCI